MASTKIFQKNNSHILYDACAISKPSENLFDPVWLEQNAQIKQIGLAQDVNGEASGEKMAMGRGAAWSVNYDNQDWVLRHYKRGGMVAHWNKAFYLGVSLSSTRAWKEWYFLNSLFSLGLPVPQPIAAYVNWTYSRMFCLYTAAILIKEIPSAVTLAEKCQQQGIDEETWKSVGACIQIFHRQGVYHADLNANNILFDPSNKVYLIDFDKSCIKSNGVWKSENLKRLHRSLNKLQGIYEEFNFSEQNWDALMDGYNTEVNVL